MSSLRPELRCKMSALIGRTNTCTTQPSTEKSVYRILASISVLTTREDDDTIFDFWALKVHPY
jgi:hypothetical protein